MLAAQLLFVLTVSLAAATAAQAPPTPPSAAPPSATPALSGYVPERVFDTRSGTFSDFELMVADLAHADVVLIGEQHDDPNTHRLEAAVLEGLLRRRAAVVVSLEMFERDVQP
ncbi:MAG: ChaN family lipoprotein, partial [Vicinamibacterales bacterium]